MISRTTAEWRLLGVLCLWYIKRFSKYHQYIFIDTILVISFYLFCSFIARVLQVFEPILLLRHVRAALDAPAKWNTQCRWHTTKLLRLCTLCLLADSSQHSKIVRVASEVLSNKQCSLPQCNFSNVWKFEENQIRSWLEKYNKFKYI